MIKKTYFNQRKTTLTIKTNITLTSLNYMYKYYKIVLKYYYF